MSEPEEDRKMKHQRPIAWLVALSLAFASVGASSWMAYEVRGDQETVRAAVRAVEKMMADQDAQELTATWKDADGITHTVTTPRRKTQDGADEPATAWVARHQEAVAALKTAYPPA